MPLNKETKQNKTKQNQIKKVKDYKRKTSLLIDMSIPTDNNISIKEYNKISKYRELEIEIEKMWHQ